MMYRIILASESPRRKEIMEIMGIPFETVPSDKPETAEGTEPSDIVQALAAMKAENAAEKTAGRNEEVIIIGADTMVFFEGQALGKPKDEADAERMLMMLSDNVHEVYSGVFIIIRNEHKEVKRLSFCVCTKVAVHKLTTKQIRDYIATGEPLDKAGAYAIQGRFGIYIKEISGDYYNVVGFPIAKIYEKLLEQGIDINSLR